MGQILLVRADYPASQQWDQFKAEKLKEAELRCKDNNYLPPWGCKWFAVWKDKVDEAVKHKQELWVYYFKEKVGCGKMKWEDLTIPGAIKIARADTGLGCSQTAEVAYLDRKGYKYKEQSAEYFTDDCYRVIFFGA